MIGDETMGASSGSPPYLFIPQLLDSVLSVGTVLAINSHEIPAHVTYLVCLFRCSISGQYLEPPRF